jgi:tartrate-resistant acid phosphatase type 5
VDTSTPEPLTVRFAVIGDFGISGPAEAQVADLVHSWQPDIILTVGDNNYPLGAAETIDENIGQYYHDYIFPYTGDYGPGAEFNRFFPTLGNHDWYTEGAQPYFDYFTLPGNERYYDFTWGPVHFFALNSGDVEPDGVGSRSVQAAWLQERMTASTLPWQVVYFHYAPYSSGEDGPITWMRWPYTDWGADTVLAGHYHAYERLLVDGIPYFVLVSGGAGIYNFLPDPLPETKFRYNADNGAMLVTASETEMLFEFYSRAGNLVDSYLLTKP